MSTRPFFLKRFTRCAFSNYKIGIYAARQMDDVKLTFDSFRSNPSRGEGRGGKVARGKTEIDGGWVHEKLLLLLLCETRKEI